MHLSFGAFPRNICWLSLCKLRQTFTVSLCLTNLVYESSLWISESLHSPTKELGTENAFCLLLKLSLHERLTVNNLVGVLQAKPWLSWSQQAGKNGAGCEAQLWKYKGFTHTVRKKLCCFQDEMQKMRHMKRKCAWIFTVSIGKFPKIQVCQDFLKVWMHSQGLRVACTRHTKGRHSYLSSEAQRTPCTKGFLSYLQSPSTCGPVWGFPTSFEF